MKIEDIYKLILESLHFCSQPKASTEKETGKSFARPKDLKSQPLPSVFWHIYKFSALCQRVSVYPTDIVFDI